ncbi:g1576 [Coccomyxa viridis]|uniref:Long-chain-fatty-acid--CoA ligase n=1 Tax=Coccomyxa viridis TaxID=1274662 RepID=A0ABP1FKG1_9CHLO
MSIAYSVELPERLAPSGPWLVHRSASSPSRLVDAFPPPDDNIKTLYDNYEHSFTAFAEVPYLGQRFVDEKGKAGPYHWLSYAEVSKIRTEIGSGLLYHGMKSGSTLGLYSVNCRDWVLVECASVSYSIVTVPLYDTLGPDAVRYISNHAELSAVACSVAVLPMLLQSLQGCPSIFLVVVFGMKKGQRLPRLPSGVKAEVVTLESLIKAGKEHPRSHIPPQPTDIATLCYTSGTTGVPKGAMLAHASLIADAAGSNSVLNAQPGDRHLSYLPLAHIYERVTLIGVTHGGVSVGFYRGEVTELLDDMLELQPTIFTSVPRLYNRIYDRVMGAIRAGNPVARRLFAMAYASKRAALEQGDLSGGRFGGFWDRLVFSKIKARLGGHVRIMTTGSAPISPEVMEFLRICFGATVIEGYGMTETACTITMTHPDDTSSGHVGGPLPCCEIKLADLPEMNYLDSDRPYPRGEICVRGPTLFQGYYKDEVQTREILDADGWLHTGDVGMWLEGGRLKIIDRKKNIFKLAQGEYISPEKIENVYMRSPLVAQVFVYGESLQPNLVAVAVPDPETLLPWAASRGLPQDMKRLVSDPSVVAAILNSMLEEGRTSKLQGFEQVTTVTLVEEAFSVENGLLTPTMKLKRPQAKAKFQDAINRMYKKALG